MTAIATPEILFLFEDEVREAGRRLARARDLRLSKGPDDEISTALVDAIEACMAALAGTERDDVAILLARKPDLGLTAA